MTKPEAITRDLEENQPFLDDFFNRGREFLGVPIPVICGAMTWVSDHKLVGLVSGIQSLAEIMDELLVTAEATLKRANDKMLRVLRSRPKVRAEEKHEATW
jgi:NAD(P)H-dependent flavin oxidoreductase YrpB (nitropropane dioxygenase family)